jgi:hypothetical protein
MELVEARRRLLRVVLFVKRLKRQILAYKIREERFAL